MKNWICKKWYMFFIITVVFTSCFILNQNMFWANELAQDTVTVVIDPGHGGDPLVDEANGGANYQNIYEKDLNLIVAKAMEKELNTYKGVKVYLTRSEDISLDLQKRIEFAKEKNADILIALHFNASERHLFYGSEVWVSAFGENYSEGYSIATCFMNQFQNKGLLDRGIKTRIGKDGTDYYGIIRHGVEANIPAIIVEHCYMDDTYDYQFADSNEELLQFGINDATAVANYYGLNKDAAPKLIQKTVSMPVLDAPVLPDPTEPEIESVELLSYDFKQGKIKVKIQAYEPESKLLYYGYSLNGGESYSSLMPWNSDDDTEEVELSIPKEYQGNLQIVLFNNYNMDTLSEPLVCNGKSGKSVGHEVGVIKEYDLEDAYDFTTIKNKVSENALGEIITSKEPLSKSSRYEIILFLLVTLFLILLGIFMGLLFAIKLRKGKLKNRI
ncbi:MAG: N-acetylmuramoyl-L-alanine amidase [Lachnospiraceae bacterium]|nr:N-acetylmuramoyl-L-alanine amidase [Lachnospiraceae bacterium]